MTTVGATVLRKGSSHESAGIAGAAVAVTAWGGASVIVKVVPLGAMALAAYRFATYVAIVGPWRTLTGRRLTASTFVRSVPGGLWLAADVALFFTAVQTTTIVNATVIGALQPVVLTAYGVRFLGERVTPKDLTLGMVALAGTVAVIVAGTSSPEWNPAGDLAAVGALISFSAYFIAAKKAGNGPDPIDPGDFTLAASIVVAVSNVPMALLFGETLAWPSAGTWGWIVGLALGAGILGHNLMNWSLPQIPLWLGSTFTLLVPVVSSALAWMFLDESLNVVQMAAIAVVVTALALLVASQPAPSKQQG